MRSNQSDELATTKERLERSLAAGNIAWWEMEYPSGKVEFNEHKVHMLGYTMEEFADCHYTNFTDLVHPEDHPKAMEAMWKVLEGKTDIYEVEYRIRAKDGSYRWFYDRGGVTARSADGVPALIKGVVLDISQQKKSAQELEESVRRQTLLLRELRHRTKNNLNMIVALVSAHQAQMRLSEDAAVLDNLMARLKALSLTYDHLAAGDNPREVDVCDYLSGIVEGLGIADLPTVHVDIACSGVTLPTTVATPLGMIVNELLTNAVKHAFPHGGEGTIRIGMTQDGDHAVLTVEDDGVGATAESASETQGDSLGLVIVEALVAQISATMETRTDEGTAATIRIPIPTDSQGRGAK